MSTFASIANDVNMFSYKGIELLEAFLVDRQLQRREEKGTYRRPSKIYGDGHVRKHTSKESRFRKKIPRIICIACNQKGCHSSKYQKTGERLHKRFPGGYLVGRFDPIDDEMGARKRQSLKTWHINPSPIFHLLEPQKQWEWHLNKHTGLWMELSLILDLTYYLK